MSKSSIYLATTVILSLFTIAGATFRAGSQSEDVNTSDKEESAADQNIAYLTVSSDLARIAEESRDAILMLAAARLQAMVVTEEETRSKTSEGQSEDTAVEAKPEDENLYALAEEFAGTNEQLHAVIEASKSSTVATRGNTRGATVHYDRVLSHSTDDYRIRFEGRRLAEIAVIGDGDTDLDLFVYDENGNLVCDDIGYTDQAYCSWTPSWTGTFRVEIENLGGVYNAYGLLTN